MNQKTIIILLLLIIGVLGTALIYLIVARQPAEAPGFPPPNNGVGNRREDRACTMEAKLCPDGSSVGRNGMNNCEFDPCPGETPQ